MSRDREKREQQTEKSKQERREQKNSSRLLFAVFGSRFS